MEKDDNIELRSEKARNIIGQIPPRLIRLGNLLIFVIFIAIILFCNFYEFAQNVEVSGFLLNRKEHYEVNLFVSPNYSKFITKGSKVYLTFGNDDLMNTIQIETQIETVPDRVEITDKAVFFRYIILLNNSTIENQTCMSFNIIDSLHVNANISTKPTSLLRWLSK